MKKNTTNTLSQYLQYFAVTMFFLLFMGLTAYAVPAKPGLTRQLTLADGSTVSARLVGDEFCHYWLGQDGKAYQANGDVFQAIDVQVIKSKGSAKRNAANKQRAKRLQQPKKVGAVGSYIGQKKGIIILVNFKDTEFKATQADYYNIANTPGYSEGSFKGSMNDYFLAQSEGKFSIDFDVVGPYTVSQNASYYGKNDSWGNDMHPAEMAIDALKKANADVNFADYDWDGDGTVEQVYFVYAGKGEADGGSSNTIWPHAYTLSEASYYGDGSGRQKLDGVYIDTYACGSEKNGYGETNGIGTMCHEFSHCMGYPDFYDTDYSGGQGMGEWDLMDSGSYNGDGYCPAGYTAYERWMAGWSEPIELTSTQTIDSMKALQDGGEAYIIYNKGNSNEYFILENRQKIGWDKELPGEGLLIVHVDYDATAWANNQPNDNPNHQRMTWIPADNTYQYQMYDGSKYYTTSGMATDTYPYGSVNAFGKNTTPAAKLYNKNSDGTYYLDTAVEGITQNADGTISFRYVAPNNIAAPVFSPKAGQYAEPQTVTISCDTEGAIIYYTTDGTNPTTNSQVYAEPITVSETMTLKAIAVLDGEESGVVTAKYVIGEVISNPDKFVRVASVDDVKAGQRYIIACGSKAKVASKLNSTYLISTTVAVEADTITITDGAAIFVINGDQNSGYTLLNEETNEYLYAIQAKKLGYTDSNNQKWSLKEGNNGGVVMSFDYNGLNFGTMLYNTSYSRFNAYTSNPSSSMIQANLYVEYAVADTIPSDTTIVEKQDVTLTFSATEAEVIIGEDFIAPTLTIGPVGTMVDVTYSSSEPTVATVDETTGEVTIVGEGTTIITAAFEGDDTYNPATASYTLTVSKKQVFTITAIAGEGGSITLSSEQVEGGEDVTVTIVPNEDYELATLTVDGVDVTNEVTDLTYVIHDVQGDVEVKATFCPTAVYITIGPEGMVAYSCDYDLDFSGVEGITAYVACGYVRKANAAVMLPVTNMPAYEGMVLKGEPGTYKVPCVQASDYYVNILKGAVQQVDIIPTNGRYTNYFLTGGADGMAFCLIEEESIVEANSAVLQLPSTINVEGGKVFILFIEQDEQGNKCDVNGDGAVDVADISTIIDEMAARARMQR